MALTIEDGTIVANAVSYVTAAEARAYALARGVTLSAVDAEVEQLLIRAMDYLEAKRAQYQGAKVDPLQSLQWPRTDVIIDCNEFPFDEIPNELKKAQCQLALEAHNGIDLMPTRSGGFVKLEKVGPIETQFSEKVGAGVSPDMTAVDALLSPLFAACGQRLSLRTVRV